MDRQVVVVARGGDVGEQAAHLDQADDVERQQQRVQDRDRPETERDAVG